MDVREKLVEILKQAPFEGKVLDEWWWEEKIKRIADHLIANGVTVQEWVSVKDRLPVECPVCGHKNNTPQTNADRIRAMSDEELAKLIVKHKPLYSWCKGVREIWMKPNVTKVQAWLEWLQQPAEED